MAEAQRDNQWILGYHGGTSYLWSVTIGKLPAWLSIYDQASSAYIVKGTESQDTMKVNEEQETTKKGKPLKMPGAFQSKPGLTRKWGIYFARITLILLFVSGFLLSMVPLGRATLRAALLLPELLTASEPAALEPFNDPTEHIQMTLNARNGPVYVDVYAPTTPVPLIPGTRGGVINIVGVGNNRTLPQLINFSQSLAHMGVVVMNMTTPNLIGYDISVQDSNAVVQVFLAMAHWPGVNTNHIGIIGFSAGGVLACLASVDPRIQKQVASIGLFGSYFNAISLLRIFGQRAYTVGGHKQPWNPTDTAIRTLSNIITRPLPPYEATRIVSALAPGGKKLTSKDLAQMTSGSVAVYHLLVGDEPNEVDKNMASLPPQIQTLLVKLSPSTVVDKIRAPIYLLHDRGDQSIPVTESRDFAATLTRINHPHEFAEFGIFQHVQVRTDLGLSQLLNDVPVLLRLFIKSLLSSS